MKKELCKDLQPIKEVFNDCKFTTAHKLKNEEDKTGLILVLNSVDKAYFWLKIGMLEQQYKNIHYWISGSFRSNEPLYVLIRYIEPEILKNENMLTEISGNSYNEIIEFHKNIDLINQIAEDYKSEQKKKKTRTNKKKVN